MLMFPEKNKMHALQNKIMLCPIFGMQVMVVHVYKLVFIENLANNFFHMYISQATLTSG